MTYKMLGSIGLSLLAASCTLERRDYKDDDASTAGSNSSATSSTAGAATSATSGSPDTTSTSPLATVTAKPSSTAASSAAPDPDAGAPEAGSSSEPAPDASASQAPGDSGAPGDTSTPDPDPTTAPTDAPPDSSVPVDDDVHGRVIDFYGRALPDIDVRIGEATTTTDDDGEFTIPDVPETYTLDFRVNRNGVAGATYTWRYIGLTRRDPTVQSFQSSLPQRNMGMLLTSDLPSTSTDLISVAFGTDQGSQGRTFEYNGSDNSVDWAGPTSIAATGHGLVMHVDDDEFPTGYGAYETKDISFSDGADLDWAFAVDGETPVAVANVSGTVSVANEESRSNFAFVNFTSNAVISLFETYPTDENFTYLVPSIPNASVLLLAENTGQYDYSGAYAYRYGIAPGQSNVTLQIQAPPVPEIPLPDDTVDEMTEFSWDNDAPVSIVRIEDNGIYRGVYIVTTQKTLTAEEAGLETLRRGQRHFWSVATHGDCASLDECTGADGILDPMYFYDSNDFAVVKRDGSAAWSTQIYFDMAP
jgi:hypothetical protein